MEVLELKNVITENKKLPGLNCRRWWPPTPQKKVAANLKIDQSKLSNLKNQGEKPEIKCTEPQGPVPNIRVTGGQEKKIKIYWSRKNLFKYATKKTLQE